MKRNLQTKVLGMRTAHQRKARKMSWMFLSKFPSNHQPRTHWFKIRARTAHKKKYLIKWLRSQKQITEHTWSKSSSSCSFSSLSSSLSSASKSSSLALSALSCFLDELAVRTCLISSTMLRTCFSSRCDPETWKQMPASFSLKQHLKENWWLKKYNKQNHWDFRTAQYSTHIQVLPWCR